MGPFKKQRTRNSMLSQIFLYSWGAEHAPISKAETFACASWNFQHRIMLLHLILTFLPWSFEMVGEQFSNPPALWEVSPTLFFKETRSCKKSVTLSHSLKPRRWDVWPRSKTGWTQPQVHQGVGLLLSLVLFVGIGYLILIFTELILTLFPNHFSCSLCTSVSTRPGRGPIA